MRPTKGKTNKRKKYAPEYKAGLVLEIVSGKRTVAEMARTEKIKDSVLYEFVTLQIKPLQQLRGYAELAFTGGQFYLHQHDPSNWV